MTRQFNVSEFVKRLMTSAWGDADENTLRERRSDVLTYLDDDAVNLTKVEQELMDEHSEQIAKLYDVLAQGEDIFDDPAEKESLAALIKAQEDDAKVVGHAFAQGLLPGLSSETSRWDRWFHDVHSIDDGPYFDYLERRPDVVTAQEFGGYPEKLLRYGVVPMTFFHTSRSIWNLYRDRLREGVIKPNEEFQIWTTAERDNEIHDGPHIPFTAILNEIELMTEGSPELVEGLYDFMFEVVEDKHPYFIQGFETKSLGDSVFSLHPLRKERSIQECWSQYVRKYA